MRALKTGVVAVILAGSFSVAQAATCYRNGEIQADQAVRFQAQLMVLSDTCGSASYTDFSRRNAATLADYQQTLIGHFRRADGRSADRVFDRFITELANKMSLSYGKQSVAALCTHSADFLATAQGLNRREFVHYVDKQAAIRHDDYRTCKR